MPPWRTRGSPKAEAVKGSVKKTAGRLTGSRPFKGNMKQAGAKVKDAVKH